MYFEAVLENNGYTVSIAQNGEEAFDIMDKEHIDLVVLDIMMPRMDGYEFTKTLRECDNNLPILTVGNGIGLAIVKRIVELHNGSIDVQSGGGMTTFCVTLPKQQR